MQPPKIDGPPTLPLQAKDARGLTGRVNFRVCDQKTVTLALCVMVLGLALSAALAATLPRLSPRTLFITGVIVSLLVAVLAAVLLQVRLRRKGLHAQQSLLASIVANHSDAIVIESLDGRVLGWHGSAPQLFGYTADEATGRHLADLIVDPASTVEHAAIIAKCANWEKVPPFDAVRKRRDGTSIDVSIAASPILGDSRQVIAIANTIRDIKARKSGEEQLRRAYEALETEVTKRTEKLAKVERDLRAITDAMPSMVAYWDRDQTNRFANKAYAKWYGFEPASLRGTNLVTLFGAERYAAHLPHFEAVLSGKTVTYERITPATETRPATTAMVHYIPDTRDGEVLGFYVMLHDITEITEAQRRSAESERFLEQAGAVAGVGGFRIDLSSGAQVWTRQTFKVFEIPEGPAPCTEEFDRLMAPEAGAKLWGAIRIAAETGAGYDIEIAARTASGRDVWIRTIGVVELEAGRPVRVVGAIQDVTGRKRAEEALRITNERFSLAAQAAGIGVWEWDLSSDALVWDDRMYELYGRTRSATQLPFKLWSNSLHPNDRLATETAVQDSVSKGSVFDLEFRIVLPDGANRYLRSAAKIQRNAFGEPIRMVGIDLDITDQKLSQEALIASELKFRSLFELSPVGISLNDMQTGQFLEFNEALREPTGYSRDELQRRSYWDITPKKYSLEESQQSDSLRGHGRYGPYEKEYVRKDGTTYPVLLSGILMRTPRGRDVIWSIVQDISLRKAMESQMADAARRDKLTGLANRAAFLERLESAVERVKGGRQSLFAVLFLDFDRFKLVNDTLGHDAGDELLRQIADRLRGMLRASDVLTLDEGGNVVSRFGGDEFLLLVNDLNCPDDAVRVAERLLNFLAPAYNIQGSEVHSSASIGIVTSDRCCTNPEEIIRNADLAMYEAKRAGRACSVVFNEAMHTRLARHVRIEGDLRRAIGADELHLVYQPVIELASGAMVSAEALIRWNHPTLGAISPSEFVPIAEESGLILALGQWVQSRACQAMAEWHRTHPDRAPNTISVNLARAELALGQGLIDQLSRILEQSGVPPERLQLEITERELMRDPESARTLMKQLQIMGIQLAMDDFGTGTSSLGLLRNFPFDTVKIDRSFVEGVADNGDVLAVMHATINLIENLGMHSLAEGVEDATQVATLQSLGCRYAQGYLFSRPVEARSLLDWCRVSATQTSV